jgi:hypothetical protein
MLHSLTTRIALVLALAVTASRPAGAADQTILGRQLVVKNPSTPDRRQLVVKATEDGSPNTIVGDPSISGATLSITVNGATPSDQIFRLPPGIAITGKPFWSFDAKKGFRYKDAKGENGPVKVAQIKKSGGVFQIKAVAVGHLGAITVLPPNPGTGGCVGLRIDNGDTYYVRFADGQVTNDGAQQFKVLNPVTEGTCTLPCSVEEAPCGNCGHGRCVQHCETQQLICVDATTGVESSCTTDSDCPQQGSPVCSCVILTPSSCWLPCP